MDGLIDGLTIIISVFKDVLALTKIRRIYPSMTTIRDHTYIRKHVHSPPHSVRQ